MKYPHEKEEFCRVAKLMQEPNAVFVFGSNTAGRHGAGAARFAWEQYDAMMGVGSGFTSDNSYAVPTKNGALETLPLRYIAAYVGKLKEDADYHDDLLFVTTRLGCGLAGLTDEEVAPLFKDAPRNILLPIGWREMNGEEEDTCGLP